MGAFRVLAKYPHTAPHSTTRYLPMSLLNYNNSNSGTHSRTCANLPSCGYQSFHPQFLKKECRKDRKLRSEASQTPRSAPSPWGQPGCPLDWKGRNIERLLMWQIVQTGVLGSSLIQLSHGVGPDARGIRRRHGERRAARTIPSEVYRGLTCQEIKC